jgi:hypothetical protein
MDSTERKFNRNLEEMDDKLCQLIEERAENLSEEMTKLLESKFLQLTDKIDKKLKTTHSQVLQSEEKVTGVMTDLENTAKLIESIQEKLELTKESNDLNESSMMTFRSDLDRTSSL